MVHAQSQKEENVNRNKTCTKRKAKIVKQKRIEVNCEVVIKTIAPQHNAHSDAEPIGPLELYYEEITSRRIPRHIRDLFYRL